MPHVTRVRIDNETFHIRPEHREITTVNRETLEHDTMTYDSYVVFNEVAAHIIGAGEVL